MKFIKLTMWGGGQRKILIEVGDIAYIEDDLYDTQTGVENNFRSIYFRDGRVGVAVIESINEIYQMINQ